MSSGRSVADRVIRLVTPRVVESFRPPPREIAPNLFELERLLRMPAGPNLPSRTTIVRLSSGRLVVLTPPPAVGAAEAAAITAIGMVDDVVAPNSFHYVHAADFLARFHGSRLLVSPSLPARIPSLPPCNELESSPPERWHGELDLAVLGPVRGISETVFFHHATRTLVLADLAFHMVRFTRALERFAWRASGVPAGFGPSRTARTLLLGDHAIASRFLRRVLEWPFERIVVGHGDVIHDDAAGLFRRAYARWLT